MSFRRLGTGGARQRVARRLEEEARSRSPARDLGAASSEAPALHRGAPERARVEHESPLAPAASDNDGLEFRRHILKLFLRNRFSGEETAELLHRAAKARAEGVSDVANVGSSGRHMQNSSRDLMTRILRTCTMPSAYFADVPLYDADTGGVSIQSVALLLPHELLAHMVADQDLAPFLDLPEAVGRKANDVCRKLGVDAPFICLGLHGDAVPHTKNRSIEVLSWNFLAKGLHRRFPICAIEKDFCAKGQTLEKILEIVCWSLKCLSSGRFPTSRHDRSPWTSADKARKAKARAALPCRAGLLEIRGDWAWYKEMFNFPSWSSHTICWQCRATQRNGAFPYHDFSTRASWRSSRYYKGEFFAAVRAQNLPVCCLFSLPGVSIDMVMIDVLHAMDLGITQDVVGNLFFEMLELRILAGASREARLTSLWAKLKAHYKAMKTSNRLQKLTMGMVKADKKPPKLRTKAAETRHIMPFAVEIAQELHAADPSVHNATILQMVSGLFDLYMMMGLEVWPAELASSTSRKVGLLYKALSDESIGKGQDWRWRMKPKWHLFAELFSQQAPQRGDPSLFWTYADEDFVGYCAQIARSRGGPRSAAVTARKVIERYRALESLGS